MQAILLMLALFGQNELPLPPAPASEAAPIGKAQSVETQTVPEMRAWLLAQLTIDQAFDATKSAEVAKLLEAMDELQMRSLIKVYKERTANRGRLPSTNEETQQKQVLDQSKLDLQQAEAYRDHLKREYDRQLLTGFANQNLVYQNIVNNQRAMYMYNNPYVVSPYGIGPYGYGGIGYPPINYGWYGYGYPGFGSAVMYGGFGY